MIHLSGDWSPHLHHRSIELGRFIRERLVSRFLEPDEFLRRRSQCVERGHARFGRDPVITAPEKEEDGHLQRAGATFTRFSVETSAHIASRENRKPRNGELRCGLDHAVGSSRTARCPPRRRNCSREHEWSKTLVSDLGRRVEGRGDAGGDGVVLHTNHHRFGGRVADECAAAATRFENSATRETGSAQRVTDDSDQCRVGVTPRGVVIRARCECRLCVACLALRRARFWARGPLSSLTTLVGSEVSPWAVSLTRMLTHEEFPQSAVGTDFCR
jgi:hypothetical protein